MNCKLPYSLQEIASFIYMNKGTEFIQSLTPAKQIEYAINHSMSFKIQYFQIITYKEIYPEGISWYIQNQPNNNFYNFVTNNFEKLKPSSKSYNEQDYYTKDLLLCFTIIKNSLMTK